jgi:hypothetical protein
MANQNRAPKSFEIRFAYQLLRYLGGNVNNAYLILAIIAWVRAESGTRYIGNNPLNIRNSKYAIRYRKAGGNGHFAVFASLSSAAKATASFLKANAKFGKYSPFLNRIREQSNLKGDKLEVWNQEQARDALFNIALSKWSSTHYGYGKKLRKIGKAPTLDDHLRLNRIIPIYNKMLGTTWTIPASVTEPWNPKPLPYPQMPRQIVNAVPQRIYIDPYGASGWFNSRWEDTPVAFGAAIEPEW